jgi:hypothetical protein
MSGSNIQKRDVLFSIYNEQRTVFSLIDISMLVFENDKSKLSKKLNYYVKNQKLNNPRKGIYTKMNYSKEELACRIFTPVYISLGYVLQKEGVIFQYDSSISSVSYLNRQLEVDGQKFIYRKIKDTVLSNTQGIEQQSNFINIASTERAFLDLLYLEPDYYFDNLNPLDVAKIRKLLPLYQSKALNIRVNKLFEND